MIHDHTTLHHHLLQLAIADAVLVPPDTVQDALSPKVPPFEISHELVSPGSQHRAPLFYFLQQSQECTAF